MHFGNVCYRARAALNLTLGQMAEHLEVPQSTLAKVERGEPRFSDNVIPSLVGKLKLTAEEAEILSMRTLGIPRDLASESAIYRAVKHHRAARKELGLPLE